MTIAQLKRILEVLAVNFPKMTIQEFIDYNNANSDKKIERI